MDSKELIVRFLGKSLDENELVLLTNWMKESYENRKLFDQYNEVWQISNVVFNKGYYNTDAVWNSVHQKITNNNTIRKNKIRLLKSNQLVAWKVASVAAMMVAALFLGFFLHKGNK